MTTLNIDSARSYKTEANLDKAVREIFPDWKYLTVCNREGRFTAIFSMSSNQRFNTLDAAHLGFMVVN